MGHQRLNGRLPDTAPWRKVVGLVADGGDIAAIAGATSQAAQIGLDLAENDEGLKQTFYLLTQVVLAARDSDFQSALREIGVIVPAEATAFNIVAGFTDAIDKHLRKTQSRTDIGEMAQLAAVESITATLSPKLRNLFETTHVDVQQAVRDCSTQVGFANLAHDFFSRFTQRFLSYHLSRELANHVGEGKRFSSPVEHAEFVDQLATHCRQTSLIVKTFAGEWYSKHNFLGGITPTKVKGFVWKAVDKLRNELALRGERDG